MTTATIELIFDDRCPTCKSPVRPIVLRGRRICMNCDQIPPKEDASE